MAIPDVSDRPLDALVDLTGRAAVVTGGGRGIGAACCARLAEAGAAVLVADLDPRAASETATLVGRGASPATVDVRDAASIHALASAALEAQGRLDVWVNAAGVYPTSPVLDLAEAEWDTVLDTNLRGIFLCAREAARAMAGHGRAGVVVNVSSTAAYRVDGTGVSHYVASKFGVRGLTKALAVELGPLGIRVLAVAPTVTSTPGLDAQRESLERRGFVLDELGERLPLGRIAVPDDVARVVVFCASDLSMMMTGSTLLVDGGALA
jgi:NAD(P)-dependent dehydrogenase (short-subunit alcohol dehydrogenase family)